MDSHEYLNNLGIKLRLSAQRALLGAISPNILAICVNIIRSDYIELVVYARDTLTPDQTETLDIACSEMMADFTPPIPGIVLNVIETSQIPKTPPGFWVYLPYEEA